MQRTIRAFLVATTLLQPLTAWAQAPDEAGAKEIEASVKALGPKSLSKPGIVRVSPDGAEYRLALDMAKLLADALAPMTVKQASPLTLKLAAQADGKWTFDASNPLALTMEYLAGNRSASLAITTETGMVKGLFDPVTLLPREASIAYTDGVIGLRDARDAVKITLKDIGLSSLTKDLAGGRNDVDGTFLAKDVALTHGAFPRPEVKITAAQVDGSYRIGNVDLAGVAALYRFWRGTDPGKEVETLTPAEREKLKALLTKLTPGIDEIGVKVSASNLASQQGGKGFKLEKLEYETRWEDISSRAALVMQTRLANFGVDDGVWPKGLEAALPKEAALNVRASGFDMVALWADAAQLRGKAQTAALADDHFLKLFLPDGRMTVDFSDSFVRSSFYDFRLSGQIFVGRDTRKPPQGVLTITAKDLDKTVKYLQDNAKTVPIFSQASFGMLMFKGLGKAGPEGTTVWDVKFEENGKITVNGQPLPGR